jgi:hypothetical protein
MSVEMITANRLRDGEAVWLAGNGGWVENIADAALFDADTAAAALARSTAGDQDQIVVGIYRVAAELAGGRPLPKTQKEKIRALGPSVRRDLGKQAGITSRSLG